MIVVLLNAMFKGIHSTGMKGEARWGETRAAEFLISFKFHSLQEEKIQIAGTDIAKETAYIDLQELSSPKIFIFRYSLTVNLILRFSFSSQQQQLQFFFNLIFFLWVLCTNEMYSERKNISPEPMKIPHRNYISYKGKLLWNVCSCSWKYNNMFASERQWVSVQIKFV